jgi:ubiquinone/menaquinone biosynthesis C-methylase UbiE
MGVAAGLARQLAEPSGLAGALCGAAMDLVNRVPLHMAIDMLCPVSGEVLLDAGCGTGAASEEMLRRADCSIAAIDQSATMLRRARSRMMKLGSGSAVEFHQDRLEDLPCEPGSIDAALALNVLYFCGEDSGMIAAIRCALRPGGRLVAYVTHRRSMEKWSFTREGYHRLYDEKALRGALVEGGFDPKGITICSKTVAPRIDGLFALAHAV